VGQQKKREKDTKRKKIRGAKTYRDREGGKGDEKSGS